MESFLEQKLIKAQFKSNKSVDRPYFVQILRALSISFCEIRIRIISETG